MKKIYTILVCLCMLAGFVACEKDKEFVLTTLTVTNETVTPSYETAEVSCSFKADATISEAFVQYSLSSGFAKYDVAKMTEEKGKYMAQLTDLVDNTTYYIRYAVSNKYSSVVTEEVVECQTLPCTVPTIVLDSIGEVRESHAKAYLHLTFDGGASVTDIGICWSKQANPTIEDIHKSTKDTVAVLDITDLQENTKYYVRAYAVNKVGVAYSEEQEFTTSIKPKYVDLGLPSGVKWATFNVGANSPEESGDYYAWGETSPKSSYTWLNYKWCEGSYNMLTKYNCDSSNGVVDYKTILDPEDDAATVNWGQGWRIPTKAEFDELIDNCTWTWSSINGVYGYEVKSNTNGNSIFLPSVGYYNDNTFQTYSSRYRSSSLGVNTPPYFLNFNASYIQIIFQGNQSDGYAIRPVSGDYAPDVPTVITSNVIEITNTSVSVVCEIIRDGGLPIIECGVSYVEGTTTPIELERKIMAENNSTKYICHITGLKANTSYRVRAYAVNSKGTAYGSPVTFTTKEQSSTPNDGTENGYGYVDLGLSVKWATCNVGANKPEDYGDYFAWGETTTRDTYSWSTYKHCNGSDDSLTKYNTNSSYGTVDNKTTLELSDDAAHVNWGGSWRMPTDDELTELWEQCTWTWTTQNGVNGYKVTSKTNSSSIFLPATGYRYNSSLNFAGSYGYYWSSSLYTGSPYRAWSVRFHSSDVYRNDGGYRCSGLSVRPVLGESVVETTIPTVTTTIPTQITETTAVAGGNVTSDGGASVTERGVCISTVSNPTTSNTKITAGSGTGSFTCNLTSLQANTTYYVRAYAINEKGTAYGEEVSFTTNKQIVLPSVTTAAITQITETAAVAGGNVTSDGGASVTERGVVYATTQNPTTADNKVSNGSGMGTFTCNLTDLQPNTKYYVRAYAINSKGTAYSEQVSFTTKEQSSTEPGVTETITVNGVSFKMVAVEGGTFTMGATAEQGLDLMGKASPTHSVTLSDFLIGETEVTKELWYAVMEINSGSSSELKKPIVNVSWESCQTFISKLNYLTGKRFRLPTEAEWEYAARGGNKTQGYMYAGSNNPNDVAWYKDNCSNTTHPVQQKMDNELGIYDMSGNVSEWCLDWYGTYSSSAQTNPIGLTSGTFRVRRGGSIHSVEGGCRVSYRLNATPTDSDSDAGFRLAIGEAVKMEIVLPSITTTKITQIAETTAVAGGHVTSDGNGTVSERGVVYSTSPGPTISNLSNTICPCGSGTGEFIYNMTNLQPNTTYYVRAYAVNEKGTAYGEQVNFTTRDELSESTNSENGHTYVDLGLSVKWATCNVGASSLEEYGDFFAWGETEPKEIYDWSTYKWCEGANNKLTKYNTNSSDGVVDNKITLDLSDDAARVNWGGRWRTPTVNEINELSTKCTWTWNTQNGVKGYKITSNSNGKSIFIPAAGYRWKDLYKNAGSDGYYMLNSLYRDESYEPKCDAAQYEYFHMSNRIKSRTDRAVGYSVRPVLGEEYVYETTLPTVTTKTVTQITETSATTAGDVTADGNASLVERGVVYSTSQNPTTANMKIKAGSGIGNFTCNLTGLQPNTTYYVRAYAVNSKGTAYGEEVSFTTKEQAYPSDGTENGYAYVDLGLSVKWATMNVGASKPEDYGDYYAWGETTTKTEYNWSTYKYCYTYYNNLTKYNTYSSYGTVDNKTTLELGDDAAHANWGSSWRMPNEAELSELCEQCTWTWTTQNGVNGYKVTSKSNGNSIFLPAAGYRTDSKLNAVGSDGCYWANSISSTLPYCAWRLNFNTSEVKWNGDNRYYGQSVRPVCP